MSMAIITQAATAITALEAEVRGKMAAINAQVDAKKAEVDTFLLNAREKIAVSDKVLFNPATTYSKTSLNLAVDPADNTRTVWSERIAADVPYLYLDYTQNFGSVELARAFASLPGFAENPSFTNDYSASVLDIVFFEIGKTSAELNARIAATGVVPAFSWDTSACPRGFIVPNVSQAGRQWALSNIYIRFRNIVPNLAGKPAGTLPQPIAGFGGNTVFALYQAALNKK